MLNFGRARERQATKISGVVYIVLGFIALVMAGFFVLLPNAFGVEQNWRLGICGLLAIYGIVRIITGILTVRRASSLSDSSDETLNEKGGLL